MKISKLLIFLIITLFLYACNYNLKLIKATNEDITNLKQAIDMKNISYCISLNPHLYKGAPKGSYAKTYYLRNHCIFNLAIETKNISLCNELTDNDHNPEVFKTNVEMCKEYTIRGYE